MDAIDGLVAAPPEELAAIPVDQWPYGGQSRPSAEWFAECRIRGVPSRVLIRETYPTRSKGGYPAGADDVWRHEDSGDAVGFDGANAVAVSDGNALDSWDCGPYALGWAAGARRRFFPYGSTACCASFRDAVRGHPLLIDGDWIPETWGHGTIARQLVGVQLPISTSHDVDTVLYDFGAPAPTQPEAQMGYIRRASDGHTEWTDGWQYHWDPAGSFDALDTHQVEVLPDTIWDNAHANIDARAAQLTAASTGGQAPPPAPPPTLDAFPLHDIVAYLATKV